MRCEAGSELEILRDVEVTEVIEEVVYRKERIKHFNREGSEYWDEVSVPTLEERVVTRTRPLVRCAACGAEWLLPDAPGGDPDKVACKRAAGGAQ